MTGDQILSDIMTCPYNNFYFDAFEVDVYTISTLWLLFLSIDFSELLNFAELNTHKIK